MKRALTDSYSRLCYAVLRYVLVVACTGIPLLPQAGWSQATIPEPASNLQTALKRFRNKANKERNSQSTAPRASRKSAHKRLRFVKTGSHTYQEVNGPYLTQIIVSQADNAEGIFVNIQKSSNSRTALQDFNVSRANASDSLVNFFIHFTDQYSKLRIGANAWDIRGSFSFLVPEAELVVTIDNNSKYLTIVKSVGSQKAIIGFIGLQAVLNSGGIVADLLAANSYRNLVLPYEIEDNVLLLDSREIRRDSSVGLALEPPQNDCVLSTEQVSFISLGAHKQILRAKDKKQRLSILKRELSKKLDPRRFAIVLSATRKQAILFNAEKGQFQRVWPVNKRGASQTVCAIEPFDLESLV